MEQKEKPWYQTTRRWAQTNFTENDPISCDLNFWRKQWRLNKVQGVVINCGGIVAYYPSRYPLQYQAKFLNGRDFFGDVVKAAREEGLKIIARMDTNRADTTFLEAHPEWFCKNKTGEFIQVAGRYYSCVNGGYYKEFIPDILREIVHRYHPEGFADNNWKGLDRNTICYCENCKEKFREQYGRELPQKPDWEDETYRLWIKWNYDIRIGIWDLFNKVVKEEGGENCLWCGMLNADTVEQGNRFVDIKRVLERSRIVFCDQQGRTELAGMEANAINGMQLRLAADEEILIPESMANYVRGSRTYRLSANPSEEARLWMLEGIAGGISPWFHFVGGIGHDRRQYHNPVPVFQWHEKNEKYLYDRQDIAEIGILWSQENTDYYGREKAKERCVLPWVGFCKALYKHRISYIPVHARDINRYMDRIKVLILPDLAVLSEMEVKAITAFLESGGSIVLSGLSGAMSLEGKILKNPKLWEYLGLRLTEGYRGPDINSSADWEEYEGHTYMRISKNRPEVLEPFVDTDLLGFGGRFCKVKSIGSLKPYGTYISPFPIFPPEFSWIHEEDREVSLIYAGELSGGGRCVYFAGDFDRCYGKDRLPDHGTLLAEAVKWAMNDQLQVLIEGDGKIDYKLYRKEGKWILHIINLTEADNVPGYMDEVVPVGPFEVTLRAEERIEGVYLAVQEQKLPVKRQGNKVSVTIDKIAMHELLVFE